jgi:S-adenosyl-L-methionine hydrolase (adenosine-forming)
LADRPIVTLTTDFGLNDHFVGTVKGVILNITPEAEIVDICHSVKPFDVLDGALTIAQAYSYFPAGTVHLVVVDPGVGTARRPLVANTERQRFVAPDNGVLSLIYSREERCRVHHITAEHYYLQPVSQTFHARDVFAPVVAYLAKGVAPEKFGEAIVDFSRLELPQPTVVNPLTLRGVVLKVDRFGNLVTNITPQNAAPLFQAPPPPFRIVVGKQEIRSLKAAYADGAPGELFAILGSMGYLEIAARQASAALALGAGAGLAVDVVLDEAAGTRT